MAIAGAALLGDPAHAACTTCSPASPVPPARHGTLVPTTILSDTTYYLHNFEPDCGSAPAPPTSYVPRYSDIDIEGGVLFGASGNHLEIFEATNPGAPVKRARICRPRLAEVVFSKTDTDEYYNYLEAPEGDGSIVVIVGLSEMGAVIVKTADPANPVVIYQDDGFQGQNVATATVGGTHHAFVLDGVGNVEVYDLARAKALTSPCRGTGCGVHKGRLNGVSSSLGRIRGAGNYVMTLETSATTVWDVSSLSSPRRVGDIPGRSRGADIWLHNGVLYAARGASSNGRLEIYDFPCQSSGTCAARLVRDYSVPGTIVSGGGSVEASLDEGRAYLYVARSGIPTSFSGPQMEYLFDVSDPANAQELTPDHPDGYWGWYYEGNSTGFRDVSSTDGVVKGGHLVRAAVSILDVHRIVQNVPPVSSFDLPTGNVYAGQNVTFTDRSSNQPTSWSWRVDGLEFSTLQNPSWLVPTSTAYPDTYDIDLEACNPSGCSSRTLKVLTVRDPAPKVSSVTVDGGSAPINAVPCQTIDFSGQGIDGRPTLALSWEMIENAGSPAAISGTGATRLFSIPSASAAGTTYQARLSVSNTAPGSPAQATSPLVTIVNPPTLGLLDPTYEQPVQNGRVQFRLNSTGATTWEWTFGDGTNATFPTEALGENPLHNYPPETQDVTYNASVTVRNCQGQVLTSQTIAVFVPAFLELSIDSFQAGPGATCFNVLGTLSCTAVPGQQIVFNYQVDGSPTSLEFDWGGDGTFEQTGVTPCAPTGGQTNCAGQVNHTYATSQSTAVTPKMRAIRGTEIEELEHVQISFGSTGGGGTGGGGTGGGGTGGGGTGGGGTGGGGTGGGGTGGGTGGSSSGGLVARFTYSPTPAKAQQVITFNASTSSGSPTTHYWEFGDGSTTTTSNTSVTKTYAQPGTFSVKLEVGKAGSCPLGLCTATTTQSVAVQASAPQLSASGNLVANFSFAPGTPKAEQAVSFNAAAEGSPTSYRWNFGDGQTAGPTANAAASHTYAAAGVYNVQLEIRKNDAGCVDGVCKATVSKLVTVAAKPRDGSCVDSQTTLCVLNGRFELSIIWETDDPDNPGTSKSGRARVVEGGTEEAGLFWFFAPDNWEMMAKVLNGCAVNDHFWVFGASTTDVGFTLIVTDTKTGLVKTYVNQDGVAAAALTDTEAFPVCQE